LRECLAKFNLPYFFIIEKYDVRGKRSEIEGLSE
jgi:hypothetical protein